MSSVEGEVGIVVSEVNDRFRLRLGGRVSDRSSQAWTESTEVDKECWISHTWGCVSSHIDGSDSSLD